MSNRRKRAPPLRMNDEKKKHLCWNMHEDRKNEVIDLDAVDEDHPLPSTSSSSAVLIVINDDSVDEDLSHKSNGLKSLNFSTVIDEAEDSCHVLTSISVQLNIVISPCSDPSWKTLLGEFILQPLPGQFLPDNIHKRSFTLMRTESSDQLHVCAHAKSIEKVDETEDSALSAYKEDVLVESSLSNEMLEDLMWLQKKRVIVLYQKSGDAQRLKVGIYLLEVGLSKLEFLSDGGGRIKKANQLIQKLMEKFYDFIIPDILEEDEESDRDIERQNIEELYDYVRHTHQKETQFLKENVQHSALIPVLRPYQSEAVNWMLQRENFRNLPTNENALHYLWREFITLDGLKLYFNPFTGCIIRERPIAGPQWPGGILADEMGLGKTVEVLALILTHTRKDVTQEALMLPEVVLPDDKTQINQKSTFPKKCGKFCH